jgi:hypothetical protein
MLQGYYWMHGTQNISQRSNTMNTEEISNTVNPTAEVPTDQPDTSTTPGTIQPDTTNTVSDTFSTAAPAAPAEPQHVQDLRTAFALALATPDFTGDKKRVEKAIKALTLPDPETRVKAQLRSNAEKTLNPYFAHFLSRNEDLFCLMIDFIDKIPRLSFIRTVTVCQ